MTTTYITSAQHQLIHDLLRELNLDAADLHRLWEIAGTPKTYAAAQRMITVLTIKTVYQRLGYDATEIRDSIADVLGYRAEVERLSSGDLGKVHKAMKQIEARRNNPTCAPLMVARMKIDGTEAHTDLKAAVHDCDHWEDETTLKVLFVEGKAVRFSIGGRVFEQVIFTL